MIRPQDHRAPREDSLILRNAEVRSVDTTARTCEVEIDKVRITGVPYLAHLAPRAHLKVKVAQHRRALLVVGTLDPSGEASPPTSFIGVFPDATHLPNHPKDGDVALTEDDGHLHVGHQQQWTDVGHVSGGAAGRPPHVTVWHNYETPATDPPASPVIGDEAINETTFRQWIYDGVKWVETSHWLARLIKRNASPSDADYVVADFGMAGLANGEVALVAERVKVPPGVPGIAQNTVLHAGDHIYVDKTGTFHHIAVPVGPHVHTGNLWGNDNPMFIDRALDPLDITAANNAPVILAGLDDIKHAWQILISGETRAEEDFYLVMDVGGAGFKPGPVDAPIHAVQGKSLIGPWRLKANTDFAIAVNGNPKTSYTKWQVDFVGIGPDGRRVWDRALYVDANNDPILPAFGLFHGDPAAPDLGGGNALDYEVRMFRESP